MEVGKVGEVGRTSWEEEAHQRFKDTASSLWADNYCQRRKTDFKIIFQKCWWKNKPPAIGRASNNMGDIDKITSHFSADISQQRDWNSFSSDQVVI